VSLILVQVYNNGGHFAPGITLRRLKPYFWPHIAKDTKDYILGCLKCAEHGTAIRIQMLTRVMVTAPMELLGIDFISPFPGADGELWYILLVIDYFSRYTWGDLCDSPDSDAVERFLLRIFGTFGRPVGIYADPGTHFGNRIKIFAVSRGITWCTSPVAVKKATGMAEKANDIVQCIIKKHSRDPGKCKAFLGKAFFEMNRREIIYLGYAPSEIFMGFSPEGDVEVVFPSYERESLASYFSEGSNELFPNDNLYADLVIDFILNRERIRRDIQERSDSQKDRNKERHDLGVRSR
jgi:hypothetical protein